jgi:hypothetical protein
MSECLTAYMRIKRAAEEEGKKKKPSWIRDALWGAGIGAGVGGLGGDCRAEQQKDP